jgi:hypothetical protein
MNTNRIEIQCAEDLELLYTITRIIKHYEATHADDLIVKKVNVYGEPYEMHYCNCKKIHDNYEKIVKVCGLRGYVVLDDNTIMCVSSSSYIWQFDGCLESEIV